MKKAISGILCLAFLALGAFSVHATAVGLARTADLVGVDEKEPPITRLAYTNTTSTNLSISGGQAISDGSITGYSGITTKVTVALYLERKTASATTWTTIASGSKTTNSFIGGHQLKTTVTKGYQYRVRAVYTAWAGTKSETLTSYSRVVAF